MRSGGLMKGQTGYIMKPMMLIAVIVLLIVLLQSIYSSRGKERMAQKSLDLVGTGTNILLILSNSEMCLAHRSSVTDKVQGNVLDVQKLNDFQLLWQNREPECARNYDFGWRVRVEQIGEGGVEREWKFGTKEFSTGEILNNEIEFWIPVSIKYSEDNVKLGKMHIRLVDGELEKLAGFFDWSCRMGELNRASSMITNLKISKPVTYKEGRLCMDGSCRELICSLVYFDGFKSKGTYELTVNYQEDKILLVSK